MHYRTLEVQGDLQYILIMQCLLLLLQDRLDLHIEGIVKTSYGGCGYFFLPLLPSPLRLYFPSPVTFFSSSSPVLSVFSSILKV